MSYNLRSSPHSVFTAGHTAQATVRKVGGDRTLLALDLLAAVQQHVARGKKGKADAQFLDSSVSDFKQIVPGKVVKAKPVHVAKSSVIVSFTSGPHFQHQGVLHCTDVLDAPSAKTATPSKPADLKSPLAAYTELVKQGAVVPFRVVSSFERAAEDDKPAVTVLQLSARPSELKNPDKALDASKLARPTLETVQAGQRFMAVVQSVQKNEKGAVIWVQLTPTLKGRVKSAEISEDASIREDPAKLFQAGHAVPVVVLGVNKKKDHDFVDLSIARQSPSHPNFPSAGSEEADGAVDRVADDAVPATVGSVVQGTVVSIHQGLGVTVQLSPHHYGRVHLTDLSDEFHKNPLKRFNADQPVTAVVLAVTRQQDKPGTAPKARAKWLIDLSLRESRVKAAQEAAAKKGAKKGKKAAAPAEETEHSEKYSPEIKDFAELKENQIVKGYVKSASKSGVFVSLNREIAGRVMMSNLADDYVKDVATKYHVGKLVEAKVLSVDVENKRVELTLKKTAVHPELYPPEDERSLEALKRKKELKFDDLAALVGKPHALTGTIKNVTKFGVFVSINKSKLTGMCHVSELADTFVKDVAAHYSVGDKVKAVVIKVDAEKKRVSLGMKPSHFMELLQATAEQEDAINADEPEHASDSEEEQAQDGAAEEAGQDSDEESGPKSMEEDDDEPANGTDENGDADDYKALIRGMAPESKAPKKRRRDSEEEDDERGEDDDEDQIDLGADNADDSHDVAQLVIDAAPTINDADDVAESDSDSDSDSDAGDAVPNLPSPLLSPKVAAESPAKKGSPAAKKGGSAAPPSLDLGALEVPALKVPALAVKGAPAKKAADESDEEEEVSDEDEDADDNESKKLSKRAKAAAKKRAERDLEEKEEALLDPTRQPQSAADFERLLMASPNSSFLWIQYIHFQLGLAEVDKARAIAKRALDTISFREDNEKWNVWVALLALENLYGTADALAQTVERALQYNDHQKVHTHLASLYEEAGKHDLAERAYQLLTRKFGSDPKSWTVYGLYLFRQNRPEDAHALLKKALQPNSGGVPKTEHVLLMTKFATMEFKHKSGSPERGRTVFEGLLSNYPKRVDVWNVFLDLELSLLTRAVKDKNSAVVAEQTAIVRRLFERAVNLSLSSKKVKHFFKRYMSFEKDHGDEATVDHVRELAKQYVASKQGDAEADE